MRDQNSAPTQDKVQQGQLIWSCAVALGLGLAALVHLGTPRNSLLEPDRAPAQIRSDLLSDVPLKQGTLSAARR